MNSLFDRHAADQEVIESLMRTTSILWRQLEESRNMLELQQQTKQGKPMSKILQDLKGAYYLVEEYEELTKEVAEEIIAHAEHDLTMVKNFIDKLSGNANDSTETPADSTQVIIPGEPATAPTEQPVAQPVEQTQPAPVEQPQAQPVEQTQPAPVDPSQQVPAPTIQPETPAADPNAAPVQTAQSDPNAIPPLQ